MTTKSSCLNCDRCRIGELNGLASLQRTLMERLGPQLEYRVIGRNELVLPEGGPSSHVYCIKRGLVKLYQEDSEGRETILRLQSSGDIVGLTCLLAGDSSVRDKTGFKAEAVVQTEACAIPTSAIHEIVLQDREFSQRLLQGMAAQSLRDQQRIVELAQKSVRARVASVLLRVADEYGSRFNSNVRIDAPLSREEIASLAGTVVESAVRALQGMRKERLISIEGREIVLLDVENLRRVAA